MTESASPSGKPAALPPPPRDPAVQAALDESHLWLLEIGFYISGVVTAVFVSFLLLHFGMFLFFGLNPQFFTHQTGAGGHQGHPPPPGLFLGLAGVIGTIILLGWSFGALQVYVGRCLKKRQRPLLIMIIAGLECLFIPWGTLLGVCTFIVMERPSVKPLFARS